MNLPMYVGMKSGIWEGFIPEFSKVRFTNTILVLQIFDSEQKKKRNPFAR